MPSRPAQPTGPGCHAPLGGYLGLTAHWMSVHHDEAPAPRKDHLRSHHRPPSCTRRPCHSQRVARQEFQGGGLAGAPSGAWPAGLRRGRLIGLTKAAWERGFCTVGTGAELRTRKPAQTEQLSKRAGANVGTKVLMSAQFRGSSSARTLTGVPRLEAWLYGPAPPGEGCGQAGPGGAGTTFTRGKPAPWASGAAWLIMGLGLLQALANERTLTTQARRGAPCPRRSPDENLQTSRCAAPLRPPCPGRTGYVGPDRRF